MWGTRLPISSTPSSYLTSTRSSMAEGGIVLTVKKSVNWPMHASKAQLT